MRLLFGYTYLLLVALTGINWFDQKQEMCPLLPQELWWYVLSYFIYMRIKICICVHPNSKAVKFDFRNKISKQFWQFWSFLTRQWLEKGLASFKWQFWQNFRWQINNVWKFYVSVSCIGGYYFTCISRKSSFAPNFSNLRFFWNSW